MFVWVFFENLGKGGYTPAGYAGVINYYIKSSHSPAAWKSVMGLMASHAAMVAPMQAATEISLGILLVVGLLTRPAAFVAFLLPGQPVGLGMGPLPGFGTTGSGARIGSDLRWTGRSSLGHRRIAGTGRPSSRGGDERICVRVSVIIPTHNEAPGHRPCAFRSAFLSRHGGHVVDSNSTDGTPISPERWGHKSSRSLARIRARLFDGAANTQNPMCRFPRR